MKNYSLLDIVRNNDDNDSIVIMHKFDKLKEQVTKEGQNDKLISEDFNSFVQ